MKKKIHIKGMHCVSCEILLEKELKKLPGFKTCKVNHKNGSADVECSEAIHQENLEKAVKHCGYEITEGADEPNHSEKKNSAEDLIQIILMVISIVAILFLLKKVEIARFFPNFGSKINVAIALLMGVVASLSTCLALTGGIVMSFGAMIKTGKSAHPFLNRAKPHLYFHAGRIGGFMILGGILGLIGSKINYSLTFTGYLTILIAVVMFYIGLQILNFVPNITKLGFHLPKKLSSKIDSLQKIDHHLAPMAIGAMTFFLPCGFTQTMQLAAVTSQNFLTGAFIMGAFALGTMPVLLSVGIGSTYAHKDKMQFFYRFVGVLILFFGLYSLNSGLILAGSPVNLSSFKNSVGSTASVISGSVQVVKMDVDWTFKPNEFTIKKGIPVRWEINGINVSGCSNEIVIPTLNIRKKINTGLNVIEFTPEKEGVLPFSCWMGMLNGRFIVTDEKGTVTEEISKAADAPIPAGSCNGSCGGTCGS